MAHPFEAHTFGEVTFVYRGVDFRDVEEILSPRGEADVVVRMKDGAASKIPGHCGDGNWDRCTFELDHARRTSQ